MPIRRSSMTENIDGFNSSVDIQKRLFDEALKNKESVKSTQLSKLHNIKTEVIYYEQVVSNRQGNLANTTSFNKFDANIQEYKKINDFVILTDELSAQMDGDVSMTLVEEGTAKILPNTLIPNINDYFIMNVFNKYSVFRITEITPSPIEKDSGYEINFILYQDDIIPKNFLLENSNITGEYVFDYNHVGTEFRTVLKTSEYGDIKNCRTVMKIISDIHMKAFYNRTLNSLFLTDDQIELSVRTILENRLSSIPNYNTFGSLTNIKVPYIYDDILLKFINKYNLISPNEFVHSLTEYMKDDKRDYRHSIFAAVERRDINLMDRFNHSINYMDRLYYGESNIKLYGKMFTLYTDELLDPNNMIVSLYPNGFISSISTYSRDAFTSNISLVYANALDVMTDIIKVFINEEDDKYRLSIIFDLLNIIMTDYIDYLYEDEFDVKGDIFYIYPIMVYIMKYIARELSSREF